MVQTPPLAKFEAFAAGKASVANLFAIKPNKIIYIKIFIDYFICILNDFLIMKYESKNIGNVDICLYYLSKR